MPAQRECGLQANSRAWKYYQRYTHRNNQYLLKNEELYVLLY